MNPNLYSRRRTVMKTRHRQPLDLAYIAAILRNAFAVRLVDARAEGIDADCMTEAVRGFAPDILITTTTPIDRWECPQSYLDSFFEWIQKVWHLPNRPVVIVTGTHGTTQPDWLFQKSPGIDYIIRGEPERTCEKLVAALAGGIHPSTVRGVSFRDGNSIVHNPPAGRIIDIDALPFPAYDLLPMKKYRYTFNDIPQPFSIVLATRGCPYRCTFCCRVMMEKGYFSRSADNIYRELTLLREKFGVRGVFFQDWEFLVNRSFVHELMDRLLANPLGIVWGCNARASDFRSPEILQKMQRAGLVRVNIGFESGALEVLEAIEKQVTVDDLAKAIAVTRKLGLKLGMYALLNAPGETTKTLRETGKFLKRQGIDSMNFNLVVPYFGTQIYEELRKQLGPGAAARLTWDTIEEYAGRVRTKLPPWLARLYQLHVKFQLRDGFLYWLKPYFYVYLVRVFAKHIVKYTIR